MDSSSDTDFEDMCKTLESSDSECEEPIKYLPQIEIKRLPVISHNSPIFRNGWISAMICGKSGCGKTSLMAELIPSISDKIKFVTIATLVQNNPFHNSIKEWCEKTKRICIISAIPQGIRNYIEGLKAKNVLIPGRQEMLLIFDDFSIYQHSRSEYENLVITAFTRWRNLGVNIIVVCQDATMIAPTCRNCTNMRILFNSASKSAIHNFTKDIKDRVPDEKCLQMLVKYILEVPYSYLMVRENPLEVSVGKGLSISKVMLEHSVEIPTYNDLLKEMHVSSPKQLEEESKKMQKEIGNNAEELFESESDEYDEA